MLYEDTKVAVREVDGKTEIEDSFRPHEISYASFFTKEACFAANLPVEEVAVRADAETNAEAAEKYFNVAAKMSFQQIRITYAKPKFA